VARERARARGAPMIVFAFAEWATAAVRMERATWADPRVLRAARSFVALRLDVTAADATAQVGADDLALNVIPTVVLLDELGHEIARVEGYAGPDEALALMGRAAPGVVPGD
jgi:thioredoxin:protein disulfide reductase